MVEIEIDGKKVEVQAGSMVMDAANKLGTYIPDRPDDLAGGGGGPQYDQLNVVWPRGKRRRGKKTRNRILSAGSKFDVGGLPL